MTDDDRKLDVASKHSAVAVLAQAAVASVALFGGPLLFPLTTVPLWAAGVIQRLTERPWYAALAALWGAGLGLVFGAPTVAAASVLPAVFFVRHFRLLRAVELKRGAADRQLS